MMHKLKKVWSVLRTECHFMTLAVCMALCNLLGYARLGSMVRVTLLRLLGFTIGKNTLIRTRVKFSGEFKNLVIGNNTTVNFFGLFDLMDKVIIGNTCQIGPHVSFITSSHQLVSNYQTRRADISAGPITVEDYVWIGANVTILGNVTVGHGSVIAAGSLVNKDVPPDTVVAGVPAKVIKQLAQKPSLPEQPIEGSLKVAALI
jgi:maltose O-acetyltransferase